MRSKQLVAFLFPLLLLGLSGCGGYYNQAVQVEDNGYLLLTGQKFEGKVLVLDDEQEIHLVRDVKKFILQGKNAIKIQISAGKHNLKIFDGGKIMINRDFYISTGTSFEVAL
ncbi:MAG: hypothetical protein K0U15_04095 [Proteobacteria bacterium]|nr:hypothetical protein [Pseudomonadota bacterium]